MAKIQSFQVILKNLNSSDSYLINYNIEFEKKNFFSQLHSVSRIRTIILTSSK